MLSSGLCFHMLSSGLFALTNMSVSLAHLLESFSNAFFFFNVGFSAPPFQYCCTYWWKAKAALLSNYKPYISHAAALYLKHPPAHLRRCGIGHVKFKLKTNILMDMWKGNKSSHTSVYQCSSSYSPQFFSFFYGSAWFIRLENLEFWINPEESHSYL